MTPLLTREQAIASFLGGIQDGSIPVDGAMSPLTKELMARFGATEVDMTSWWAWTPSEWTCTACGRPKSAIARLNQKGQLMCRLVEHHDHMQNLLLERFRQISSSQDRVVADEIAEHFAKRSSQMVSAYDNAIICNDCNNADAVAKGLASAHADFSFSPAEMRRFILAKPGQPHQIDGEIAAAIWKEQEETFRLRLRIVDRIADIAATNAHWFQQADRSSSPRAIKDRIDAYAAAAQAFGALPLLCGESRSNKVGEPSAWRYKRYPAPKSSPTKGDIDHVARVTHRGFWERLAEDWCCPGCGRTKERIVRPSGQNAWAFPIASKYLRTDALGMTGVSQVICGDCGWTVERLRLEAAALSQIEETHSLALIELSDVSRIVIPRPHCRHNFDNEKANVVIAGLADRLRKLAVQTPLFDGYSVPSS
ncbi:MAG: hypothetical protein Q8K71_02130 [Polaromonas sp.]|nr:hypothetical protein [Polaromonas sp.]